jgi:putative ABC transport system permease protein
MTTTDFYERLLRLYPDEFGRQFKAGMYQTFVERWHDARQRGRLPGVLFLARESLNVVLTGLRHRVRSVRKASGGKRPNRPRRVGSIAQDLRYAVRILVKAPGYTIVTVLTLALGIGGNTAIFTIVNGVLLRPLGYQESDRLVTLWSSQTQDGTTPPSFLDFEDWRRQADLFEGMAFARAKTFKPRDPDGPDLIITALVTEDFFEVMGGHVALGRALLPAEHRAAADPVVVLEHGYWQQELGGDPNIINRTLTFADGAYTVVGVMDSSFGYLTRWADGWMPLAQHTLGDQAIVMRDYRVDNRVIGRMKSDVTLDQARAQLAGITQQLAAAYPETNRDWGINTIPLRDRLLGPVEPALVTLMVAVGMVLLIACANVANLSLARITARGRELAVREALGASGGRLVRQLLSESFVVAAVGTILGLLLAVVGIDYFVGHAPGNLPRVPEIGVDLRVLGFTVVVMGVSTFLFGLAPAFRGSRSDVGQVLRGAGVGSVGQRRERARSIFIVAQMALALMLLVGAGLLIETLRQLRTSDPGFDTERLLTLNLEPLPDIYFDEERRAGLYERLQESVAAVPGIESASIVSHQPLVGGGVLSPLTLPDRVFDQEVRVLFRPASAGYFTTAGIPVLRGRGFEDGDMAANATAFVVNQRLVDAMWPEEDPIGKRLTVYKQNPDAADLNEPMEGEVVGVVATTQWNVSQRIEFMTVYVPQGRHPWRRADLMARASVVDAGTMDAVRRAIRSVEENIGVNGLTTVEDLILSSLSRQRFQMRMVAAFAAVALSLAAVGIYGVISYLVTQRTNEIGIRMALGARSVDVVRLVLRRGAVLTAIGAGIGVAAAVGLTRFMQSQLFGVSPTDVGTFVQVTVLLVGVALLATYLPARRAAKTDPLEALRAE